MSLKIPDQKPIWDRKHSQGEHESFRNNPSTLVKLVEPHLKPGLKILDLGSGVGRDAAYLDSLGHRVFATDFSEIIIERNKQLFAHSKVNWQVLDITKPWPYKTETFDCVLANLSIHYFSHAQTQEIIKKVAKVLKPGGLFAFACKSVSDFHYGNGEEVERDVFVSDKGHVRHLFSISYTEDLLKELFHIDYLKETVEVYSKEKSAMIQCLATKR